MVKALKELSVIWKIISVILQQDDSRLPASCDPPAVVASGTPQVCGCCWGWESGWMRKEPGLKGSRTEIPVLLLSSCLCLNKAFPTWQPAQGGLEEYGRVSLQAQRCLSRSALRVTQPPFITCPLGTRAASQEGPKNPSLMHSDPTPTPVQDPVTHGLQDPINH